MNMNDNEFGAVFALAIATLFCSSLASFVRAAYKSSYKKKTDSTKWSCCGITYETTRNVKVEEDIELGLTPKSGFGGSTETNSEFNSEFNSDSKRI